MAELKHLCGRALHASELCCGFYMTLHVVCSCLTSTLQCLQLYDGVRLVRCRHDSVLAPQFHRGLVLKHNVNQRYATNAVSAALFRYPPPFPAF